MWNAETSMRSLFHPLGLGGRGRPGGAVEASMERPQKSSTPPSSIWSHTNTSANRSLHITQRHTLEGQRRGQGTCKGERAVCVPQ